MEDPNAEIAVSAIRKGLSENKVLILIGECSVEYVGRASSKLKNGERFVIIKEDGSILIHRPKDYSPVNWHPPGCFFEVQSSGDRLFIRAVHKKYKETLRVFFKKVYALLVLDIVDEAEFALYASEEDMQKAVLAHPEIIEAGFHPVSYEKKVEPGFVDVYGVDSLRRLVVVEIKKGVAGKAAVMQLAKYLDTVRGDGSRVVRGILASPRIGNDVQQLMSTLNIEFKQLTPRKCAEVLGSKEEGVALDEYLSV